MLAIWLFTKMNKLNARTHIQTYIHIHTHTNACTRTPQYVHLRIHTHTYTHEWTRTHYFAHSHTYTHIHVCTRKHAHSYTHHRYVAAMGKNYKADFPPKNIIGLISFSGVIRESKVCLAQCEMNTGIHTCFVSGYFLLIKHLV